MGIVIFWLLCAIFSAALASSKNRSGFGWFLLGLLFGPFGLLVAFFPKVETSPLSASAEAVREETRTCPFCAETIKYAANVCRFCNRELPEVESEFVLAAEYAAKRSTTELSVIAKLREGDLVGRQVDGVWYVNRKELER